MDDAEVPWEEMGAGCTAAGVDARLFFMNARQASAGCFFMPSRQGVKHFNRVFSIEFSWAAISACSISVASAGLTASSMDEAAVIQPSAMISNTIACRIGADSSVIIL